MIGTPRSKTASQDRVAARAAQAEELAEIASRPDTPWLLGKFVALEAWRQRPKRLEHIIAERTDAYIARSEARSEEMTQKSEARLAETIGRYRRFKAGEPEFVPPSTELLREQFVNEQAIVPNPSDELPQPPDQS